MNTHIRHENRVFFSKFFFWKSCSKQKLEIFIFINILCLKAHSQVWDNFLATERPLKIMKNAFYFTSKALFVLKLFKFLPSLFGHVAKRLDKKDKVNFKFYDVTGWLRNNCNTHNAQYLEK